MVNISNTLSFMPVLIYLRELPSRSLFYPLISPFGTACSQLNDSMKARVCARVQVF